MPVHVAEPGQLEHQRLESSRPARPARPRSRRRVSLKRLDVVAQRDRRAARFADGLQDLAERRMNRCDGSARSRRRTPRRRSSTSPMSFDKSTRPNRVPRGTPCRPSSPPVNGSCNARKIDHLRQRQRDHREVDAGAADRHPAEHRAEQPAAAPCRPAGRFPGDQPSVLDQPGRNVGRAAQEGRMTEGQQPGEAQQQVEGAGEQREAQQLHQEGRVDHERRDQADQRQHAEHQLGVRWLGHEGAGRGDGGRMVHREDSGCSRLLAEQTGRVRAAAPRP